MFMECKTFSMISAIFPYMRTKGFIEKFGVCRDRCLLKPPMSSENLWTFVNMHACVLRNGQIISEPYALAL